MKQFEFPFLDRLDVPVIVRAYIAQYDLAALKEAGRLSKIHIAEVWQGDRRVARVKKGNVPLVSEDGQSL